VDGVPATLDGLPDVVDGVPATLDGLPDIVDGVPATLDGLPDTVDGVPATLDGLPDTVDGVPATLDGLPDIVTGLPAMLDDAPDTMDDAPATLADSLAAMRPPGLPMPPVRLTRFLLPVLAAAAAAVAVAPPAQATIVERVVAVIGERPLLWTELLHRAQATRVQIRMQAHDPNVVAVQEQEMYKELLDRMIDDRLEEQQADKAHIHVTPEEIDRGISNIAAQAQQQQGRPVTTAEVLGEVRRRGLTEQDFRDEIRRQIIEGKLIELRVRPRVRVTDQDTHAAYQHWVNDLRAQQLLEVRLLPKRILPGATPQQIQATTQLAESIAKRGQAGEDFCKLVEQYSDDPSTRDKCGSHGAQPFKDLFPPIQEIVQATKPGAVSDATPVHIGNDYVIVIAQPQPQAKVPGYDDVKAEMNQRALLEGLDRARKQWLEELRHNVYIDVRL
jgi:peptidyl-prolyl cis-trans isomerase SurA